MSQIENDYSTVAPQKAAVKSGLKPIYIISALFFVFGFLTWLNAVLITYLKLACQLNNLEAFFVAFAFYIAYFFMALPSTFILKRMGFKNSMAAGLIVIGVGAAIFIPAALTRIYLLFLLGLFVQGMGLAILQSASNPYITILGPIESAARRISIMGIFNKVAGALGPIILGAIILKDADKLKINILKMSAVQKDAELTILSHKVIMPYVAIVAGMVILAIFIYYSTLPEIDTDNKDVAEDESTAGKTSIFQFPYLLLGVLTLFLYVGVEVLAGDSVINYASSIGVPLQTAKFFATCTLSGMLLGYIVGIICIPRYFSQRAALKVSAVIGVIFSLVAIFTQGTVSVFFIAFLGIANALMWPALWPLAINGLGKFTKSGSSLLIMGIAGGGLIPLLYGFLADKFSLHQAYWVMVPCYLFILYYAISGYKKGLAITKK
ncbi:sugar MFS transporter [uncultured Mucilaginibacter sp.]|uniref:sugar MFS transporter n=1 Tax=uncultured Mucilaginibacter sp. TaxID=797541 RepID=UPI0025DB35EC|nr:sugar MFS transporter [uncultured Mucilaginibacter sp.]